MKEVAGVKADMHLAALLGTTRANIAKWKARNSVPFQEAVKIAFRFGGSLDYMLLGIDPVPHLKNRRDFQEETGVIRKILQIYADKGVITAEPGSPISLETEIELMANILTLSHNKLLIASSRIEKIDGVSRLEALQRAIQKGELEPEEPNGPQ